MAFKKYSRKPSSKRLTRKTVTQIAKKAAHSVSETKSFISGTQFLSPPDTLTVAKNLTYEIVQGTTGETRSGKQIYITNMRFKGAIVNNFNASTNTKTSRIMVVKADAQWVTGQGTITPTLLFRNTQNCVLQRHIDLRKVSVLYDKVFKTDYTSGGAPSKLIPIEFNIPLNKKVSYTADSPSYLKDDQYYIVMAAWDASGGITYHSQLEYTYTVNFKDA
jgi:hypothetical protein